MIFRNSLFFLIFCIYLNINAQKYPNWFINQNDIDCKIKTIGYSKLGFYIDSAYSAAKKDAILNFIRNKNCLIKGGQAFWGTEAGKFIMSSRFSEIYDTLKYYDYVNQFIPLDSVILNDCVVMLMGDNNSLNENDKIKFTLIDEAKPDWVDSLPSDSSFYYDIGFSESYFYEHSSWVHAEKMGRFSIARQIKSSIQALQKNEDSVGQEIQNEDFAVNIQNLEICGRWKDAKRKVYYVLMRIPINK